MALLRTSAPATPPISLPDAKAYCRIDGDDEDTLIASLIEAATSLVERSLDMALITQGWTVYRDAWPESWLLELPLTPLQSVDSISVQGADGVGVEFGSAHYYADTVALPPRIVLHGSAPWPKPGRRTNGIEIAVTAGFGDAPDDVPEPIRQALLLLVAFWYERREPVALGDEPRGLPGTVSGLLSAYRTVRL